jgi:hypothetical protein
MMQAGVFAHPFMYWVGMDTDPRTSPEALAEFNHFYNTIHVHEVIAAHPGFVSVSRYELLDPDPRGPYSGPRWLAVYEMADEAAALQYLKDNARPWLHRKRYSPWPAARKRAKTVWRMIWRQISATESADQSPESVSIVGTNEPEAGDSSGTRYELYREFAHPAPGCPRFCRIDVAAAATGARDMVWSLVYRRIPIPG